MFKHAFKKPGQLQSIYVAAAFLIAGSTVPPYAYAADIAVKPAAVAVAAVSSAIIAPDELVKQTVNDVLDTIRREKIQANDIKKLSQLVENKIVAQADLETTTKMVVGSAWNQASPEQRQIIIKEFKQLLIETYAGALTKFSQQTVDYKPMRAMPGDTKVIVKTMIIDGGEPKAIDYRLHKVNNRWLVYDINILGIGLVASFKPEFSAQINKSGIDGLITFLKNKTKS